MKKKNAFILLIFIFACGMFISGNIDLREKSFLNLANVEALASGEIEVEDGFERTAMCGDCGADMDICIPCVDDDDCVCKLTPHKCEK